MRAARARPQTTALRAGLPAAPSARPAAPTARRPGAAAIAAARRPLVVRSSSSSSSSSSNGGSPASPASAPQPLGSTDPAADTFLAGVALPLPPPEKGPPPRIDYRKEEARRHRRTVFDFEKWKQHRATGRYWRHMSGMASSRMVRGLAVPLLYVLGVATAVTLYNVGIEQGLAPNILPRAEDGGARALNLTSFALALLLVFRTNSSYARWVEARTAWRRLIYASRDLIRQAVTYMRPGLAQDAGAGAPPGALLDFVCRWVPAYSRVLMCHVRDDRELEAELAKVLLPHEVAAVLAAQHRPSYVLQAISEALRVAGPQAIPGHIGQRMDGNLAEMADVCADCEAILRAPIPLSYTRHTSRFLLIWLSILPFSLWHSVGLATAPLTTLVAFLLLGIEEIGVQIEEPLSILPLEQLCDQIEANVREARSTLAEGAADAAPRRAPSAAELVAAAAGGDAGGNGCL